MNKIYASQQEVLQMQAAQNKPLPEKTGLPMGLVDSILQQKSNSPVLEGTVLFDPKTSGLVPVRDRLDDRSVIVPVSPLELKMRATLGDEGFNRWKQGQEYDRDLTRKIQNLNSKPMPPKAPVVAPKTSFMRDLGNFVKLTGIIIKVLAKAFAELFRR